MSLQAKVNKNLPLHVYMHIPFCASTCDFCAFYQEKPRRQDLDAYLLAMEKEMQLVLSNGPLETIFWGGGTPGLLPAKDIERLGKAILSYGSTRPKEWTVEMAPSTVKLDKLELMKAMGVTRISMGVQSLNATLLESLGRLHNPKQVYKAYELIQTVGFPDVNLDFMFSIPGQNFKDWEQDLNEAFQLAPTHLSTYCLTFEEDTALYVKLAQGKIKRNIEQEADFYLKTWELLEAAGYPQYEVSNFAKPEHRCEHNINTWNMGSWIGIGPSASSQFNGKRFTNPPSLKNWKNNIEKGELNYIDTVLVTPSLLAADSFIFGLRLNKGVNLKELYQRFANVDLSPLNKLWTQLKAEGLLIQAGDQIRLSTQGRMLADAIGSQIMELIPS